LTDFILMMLLGFLGSFGHCASMCGPLAMALSIPTSSTPNPQEIESRSPYFHSMLSLGRILSYSLAGGALGGLSAAVLLGGQLGGIGSPMRSTIAVIAGLLLIASGLGQIFPSEWSSSSLGRSCLHSTQKVKDRPMLIGLLWGLMPCGFLYTAQLKAIESGSIISGALTMLAFGLGTTPVMLGIGFSATYLSLERRSQLRRAGGWIAVLVGIVTLGRSGDTMADSTGYGAVICLVLALVARPLGKIWPSLLSYRRLLGVGAAVLSIAHLGHVLVHNWNWQLDALEFLLPAQQVGIWMGLLAILLLLPAALTSTDRAQFQAGNAPEERLRQSWRKIHLLAVPALMLATAHAILCGASYLGTVQPTTQHHWHSWLAIGVAAVVLLLRCRWIWSLLSLEQFYRSAPPSPRE
jgi:uncharacterized protein